MDRHKQDWKRKWVLATSVAGLLIGTMLGGLRIASEAANSAKNREALAEKQSLDHFNKIVSPFCRAAATTAMAMASIKPTSLLTH